MCVCLVIYLIIYNLSIHLFIYLFIYFKKTVSKITYLTNSYLKLFYFSTSTLSIWKLRRRFYSDHFKFEKFRAIRLQKKKKTLAAKRFLLKKSFRFFLIDYTSMCSPCLIKNSYFLFIKAKEV